MESASTKTGWQRCGRTTVFRSDIESLEDEPGTVQKNVFPHVDLEAWVAEMAIWHFDGEDCKFSRRLGYLWSMSADELRGRTIKLHPVWKKDLVALPDVLSVPNVRALLETVPSPFYPSLPINSLGLPPGRRQVPLVRRESDHDEDGDEDGDEDQDRDEVNDAMVDDGPTNDSEKLEFQDDLPLSLEDAQAEVGDQADSSTREHTNVEDGYPGQQHLGQQAAQPVPGIPTLTAPPGLPASQPVLNSNDVHVHYSYDWEASFKKDASKWTADNETVQDTDSLESVHKRLLSLIETKLDADGHYKSTGPCRLIQHRQVALMSAEPSLTYDFVRDWAMRQDDNGKPRIAHVRDCFYDPPAQSGTSNAAQMHICARSVDTAYQDKFGIEPATDINGNALPPTAVARYAVTGPYHYHLVGRELLAGEDFTDIRGDNKAAIDSRRCLVMRFRSKNDYQNGGNGLFWIRTRFFRGMLFYDLDNAALAKDPLPVKIAYQPMFLNHRLAGRTTKNLSTIFDELTLSDQELEWRKPSFTYCFNRFNHQILGIGVDRIGTKEIMVAARYVNHFEHIDHLKNVPHLGYLGNLRHAASGIDFSLGRDDIFDDYDSQSKIIEFILGDMRSQSPPDYGSNLAKLFRAPLREQWQLELWVLPQIAGGKKFYRFTDENRLSHFLCPELFAEGDLRLFMEVHIVPKIEEPKASNRSRVLEKREQAKLDQSAKSDGKGGRKARKVA